MATAPCCFAELRAASVVAEMVLKAGQLRPSIRAGRLGPDRFKLPNSSSALASMAIASFWWCSAQPGKVVIPVLATEMIVRTMPLDLRR